MELVRPAARHRHGNDLKTRVLAECAAPGVSVATIALSHGLNANFVRRWLRLAARDAPMSPAKTVSPVAGEPLFIAVPLPIAPAPVPDIRIERWRGATAVALGWPVATAAECGA